MLCSFGAIREQDPLKQGLKPKLADILKYTPPYSRARSTKTRIETKRETKNSNNGGEFESKIH